MTSKWTMSMHRYLGTTNHTRIQYNPYAKPSKESTIQTTTKKQRQTTINQNDTTTNDQTIIAPNKKEKECTRIMFSNTNGLLTHHQEKITEITTHHSYNKL